MTKADVFDLLGVCLLAVFAFAVWPALSLLVVGLAALAAGRASHRGGSK